MTPRCTLRSESPGTFQKIKSFALTTFLLVFAFMPPATSAAPAFDTGLYLTPAKAMVLDDISVGDAKGLVNGGVPGAIALVKVDTALAPDKTGVIMSFDKHSGKDLRPWLDTAGAYGKAIGDFTLGGKLRTNTDSYTQIKFTDHGLGSAIAT